MIWKDQFSGAGDMESRWHPRRWRPRKFATPPGALALLLAIYLVLLLAGAVIETPRLARSTGSMRLHMGAFAVAVPLIVLMTPRWRWRLMLLALLFLFGAAIELVQYFLPWRSGTWIDLLYNALGLALGALVCTLVERLHQLLRLCRSG